MTYRVQRQQDQIRHELEYKMVQADSRNRGVLKEGGTGYHTKKSPS